MLKRSLLLFFLLFSLASCASGSLRQSNFNAREPYRSQGTILESGQSIALLTATNSDRGLEYRRLLGDFVEEGLVRSRPGLHVIPYWQGLSVINSEGFTADYSEMLKEYASTGILNKKTLGSLGNLLGARYFLQPRLIDFTQGQSTRFSVLGLTLFKTHESQIKIYIEVWDSHTGKIIWIGAAEANMASEHMRAKPIPFEEIARYAVDNLILKMP